MPTNAELYNGKVLAFATFSWIPTELINTKLYRLPPASDSDEDENQRFAKYDYKSTLLIENMGQGLLMIAFYSALIFAFFLLYWCEPARRKLSHALFWNGLIRLFMELYLELALLSILNIANLDWNPSDSGANQTL